MVAANFISPSVHVKTTFTDSRVGQISLLPQRVAVVAQGQHGVTYTTTPRRFTNASDAIAIYGNKSPIYLILRTLFGVDGGLGVGSAEVTVYPVQEDGVGGVASAGDITPSGTATRNAEFRVKIGGYLSNAFTVAKGASASTADMVAAINAVAHMPMTASDGTTTVDLESAWYGASANGLEVEVVGDLDAGISFAYTQPTGGAGNPSIAAALTSFGTRWETIVVNQMEYDDTTTLGLITTAGEAREAESVKMPFVAFTGNTTATLATAYSVSDARTTDKINAYATAPGSGSVPFVVAAALAAEVARRANENPATGYSGLAMPAVDPGTDSEQWSLAERNTAALAGCSTSELVGGVVTARDVVTFSKPAGEEPPAHRQVVTRMKLFNAIYTFNSLFSLPEWAAAPLLPDAARTTNKLAKKPYMGKADIASRLRGLEAEAIIANADNAIAGVEFTINSGNPDRVDVTIPFSVSGNTFVKAIELVWSFNY